MFFLTWFLLVHPIPYASKEQYGVQHDPSARRERVDPGNPFNKCPVNHFCFLAIADLWKISHIHYCEVRLFDSRALNFVQVRDAIYGRRQPSAQYIHIYM